MKKITSILLTISLLLACALSLVGCNKDSATALYATKDDILALKNELNALVVGAVKECLGIKEKTEPTGSALDSATKNEVVPTRDYSSFLE